MTAWEEDFPCAVSWRRLDSCKWLYEDLVLSQMLRDPFVLGGRNDLPWNGLLKGAEEHKCWSVLSRDEKVPLSAVGIVPGERERCYLSCRLVLPCCQQGRKEKRAPTSLPARRGGKKRTRAWSALPFMVPGDVCPGRIASVILIGWNI